MEENTLLALGALFREISQKHRQIAGFTYGSLTDVLAALRSDTTFPLLWMQVPDLSLEDNGSNYVGGKRMISFGVLVRLNNLDEGDNTPLERKKLEAYAQAESICLEIYRVLRKWQKTREYTLVGSPQFAAVEGITTGKDVGFMGEMVIEKMVEFCPDNTQWKEAIDG